MSFILVLSRTANNSNFSFKNVHISINELLTNFQGPENNLDAPACVTMLPVICIVNFFLPKMGIWTGMLKYCVVVFHLIL